jgi:hypothetical protein
VLRAAAPARESTLAFLRGILEEVRFALDSPLEEDGFEPSVPLLRKALLGVANRDGGTKGGATYRFRSETAMPCLEWLPIAFPFAVGPRVRIRLPPAPSRANR